MLPHLLLLVAVVAPAASGGTFVSVSNGARLDGPTFARVKANVLEQVRATRTPVKDISEISRALFSPGMVAPTFDRPVPSALEGALAEDWANAQRICREKLALLARDPARNPALRPQRALQCQADAMRAVYGRFLDRERPGRVLTVDLMPRRGAEGTSRIVVVQLEPEKHLAKKLVEDVPDAELAQRVGGVVKRALQGEGREEAWSGLTRLPTVATSRLLEDAKAADPSPRPVTLPSGCDKRRLPAAIDLAVADRLPDAVRARYAASVGPRAKAPPLHCQVVALDEAGAAAHVRAGLLCEGMRPVFTTELPRTTLLSRALLEPLLVELCAKSAPNRPEAR